VPSSNNYEGGFMVELMLKDLGLAMETASSSQSSTPLGSMARNLYTMHANAGNKKKDFSSIFYLFSKEQ
jgi:3-hydroxyisobutyrate dehydrogenase